MKTEFNKASLLGAICPPSVPSPANACLWIRDPKTRGFYLRVSETGAKAFYLYSRIKGKAQPVRIKLGDFPIVSIEEARRKAARLLASISLGNDPVADLKAARADAAKKSATLQQLWESYRDGWLSSKRPASQTYFAGLYRCNLTPWADQSIAAISVNDIEALKERVRDRTSASHANRVVSLIGAMYRRRAHLFGLPRKYSPTAGVDKYPESPRDRVLSPEELAALLKSIAADDNETVRDYLHLLIYTGQRRKDVATMKWEDISLQRETWKIPGAIFKNKTALVVTLVPDAVAILRRRRTGAGVSPYVFQGNSLAPSQVEEIRRQYLDGLSASEIGRAMGVSKSCVLRAKREDFKVQPPKPFNGMKDAWERIMGRTGIATRTTLHDVRRTFCTNLIEAGVPLPVVSAAMGHKSMATTQKHYAHARSENVAAAVGAGVAAMMAGARKSAEADARASTVPLAEIATTPAEAAPTFMIDS